MKGLFLSICILGSLVCFSQTDRLFTVTGDTLYGKIELMMAEEISEEIVIVENDFKRRFNCTRFTGFVKDSTTYRVVKHAEKYRIMRLEYDGYLSLLTFRTTGSNDFALKYLLKKDGKGIEVPALFFKKTISEFLYECPPVRDKLENNSFKSSDLIPLVTFYNRMCVLNLDEN